MTRPSKRTKPLRWTQKTSAIDMVYQRKTSPSMKPRDIRRRLDRSFQKMIRRNEQLQLLYKDECIRNRSAAIEGVLHAIFMHGFLFGGHHALELHKDMHGRH